MKHLRNPIVDLRKDAWMKLGGDRLDRLKWEEYQDLCDLLREEPDEQVRVQGIISLLEAQPWRADTSGEKLQDWFFGPFSPWPHNGSHSAVVAICDRQHIRDVQPLV